MSDQPIFHKNWNEAAEDNGAVYSRPCLTAVLAFLFGLGSFLVYFTHWFFFIGIFAVLLSAVSLRSIRNAEGALTGSGFAYCGLGSAAVALISITVFWGTYQSMIRQEANQFFHLWFAALQKGDIPQAKGYQSIYSSRSKAGNAEEWWKEQYNEKYAHRAVHQYVEDKLVRVLTALGSKAEITYYKTLTCDITRETDGITCIYAVSYPAETGGKETFFVKIGGKRMHPPSGSNFKHAGWRLDGTPAFYLPEEFKDTAK